MSFQETNAQVEKKNNEPVVHVPDKFDYVDKFTDKLKKLIQFEGTGYDTKQIYEHVYRTLAIQSGGQKSKKQRNAKNNKSKKLKKKSKSRKNRKY